MKKLLMLIILVFGVIQTEARVIKGQISCENKGISNVIVSDGTNFTQTDTQGRYSIDTHENSKFVFLVTPGGYIADWSSGTPAFYKEISSSSIDFELNKFPTKNRYNIIAIADPQPSKKAHFEKFLEAPLTDLVETATALDGTTIGIVLGDICSDAFEFMPRWKEEILRVGVPFYPVVGNHDHDRKFKNDTESINVYQSHFGPENYAFFLGKDLIIVLDNIIYGLDGKSYKEGYTDACLDWVEKLLAFIPKGTEIYIAQHSPLNGRGYRNMIINHQKILDLLKSYKVVFMSGHNHYNGVFEYSDNAMEHNISAISGAHWATYHCRDGSPSGYKVFTKSKGRLSWYYKSIGKPKDFQIEVFDIGQSTLHPESLIVNVWDYDPSWKVEWYQDGKYMGMMEEEEDLSPIHMEEVRIYEEKTGKPMSKYNLTMKSKHYFKATPTKRANSIKIKVTDRFGNEYREIIKY